MAISIFYMYSPVAYGNAWTKTDCAKAKLFETWDWDCNTFHDSVSLSSASNKKERADTDQ
jgi:dolichyl-phosphate-mannose-protein mannosyltransferase